jgi:dTMP kinase
MKGYRCNTFLLEGVDRLGKSTQTKLLVQHLKDKGFKVAFVKAPWNDRVTYRVIYWMLRNGLARKFPNVFQAIHFINKLVFQWFVLPKLLEENDYIVLDRWNLSMWAYGIPDGANEWMTEKFLDYIEEPDFTIILDGNPHIVGDGDSYEADVAYQKVVRARYVNWVVSHPCCVGQVNANQPVQDVFRDILKYLTDYSGVPQ